MPATYDTPAMLYLKPTIHQLYRNGGDRNNSRKQPTRRKSLTNLIIIIKYLNVTLSDISSKATPQGHHIRWSFTNLELYSSFIGFEKFHCNLAFNIYPSIYDNIDIIVNKSSATSGTGSAYPPGIPRFS